MSYDIRICVKVEGCGEYADIAVPEHDHPTYNLRDMFVACMNWDYSQSELNENGEYETCYYRCDSAIEKIELGIRELRTKREKYIKYNPPNGWGDIGSALLSLESLRKCIYELSEKIPINCLYMRW